MNGFMPVSGPASALKSARRCPIFRHSRQSACGSDPTACLLACTRRGCTECGGWPARPRPAGVLPRPTSVLSRRDIWLPACVQQPENPAGAHGAAVVAAAGQNLAVARLFGQLLGRVFRVEQIGQRAAFISLASSSGRVFGSRYGQDRLRSARRPCRRLFVQLAQVVNSSPRISWSALGLARRIGALPVPLQPAAGIDNRTVFFGKTGGRQTEDFGLDLGRVGGLDSPWFCQKLDVSVAIGSMMTMYLSLERLAQPCWRPGREASGLNPDR